jgi:CBS domain-containing protein
MQLPVRSRHVVGPHERVVRFLVFCPGQRRSVAHDECRSCPRLSTIPAAPSDPGACIDCIPLDPALLVPTATSFDACEPTGRSEPSGAVAGTRVVCVHAELPVERLRAAFQESSAIELPVVDPSGHLLGTVWRDDFARGRMNGGARPTLASPRRAGDLVGRAATLPESASIGYAVEVLTSRRARTLILVQGDDTVAGVLTDLDLLRWLSRARRRLS